MGDIKSQAFTGSAAYALWVVTCLNFVNYIDRFILAAVLPRVKVELVLSDFQLGLLANAFLIAYFLTSPAFGILGDRRSRPRLMAAGVAAWSVATAAAGIARNFVQLLLARAGVGVGEAAYSTISPALLSDYYPPGSRGRAFAIFYVAIPVGAASGFLLGGALEKAFGWRAAFYVVGIPGIFLAVLAAGLKDPIRGSAEIGGGHKPPLQLNVGAMLRVLIKNRSYIGTVLGYAAYTFALGGLAFFMPTYLERVRGVELSEADFMVGSVTVLAGLCGTFAGGYLGDWAATKINHGQLWICGVSSIVGIIPTWLTLTQSSSPAYVLWFFVAEFLLFLSTGPVNVAIVNIVPVEVRATAMAMSIFAIHLLGDAASPPIIGWLADKNGLASAVLIVPAAVAISGLVWTATALAGNGLRSMRSA